MKNRPRPAPAAIINPLPLPSAVPCGGFLFPAPLPRKYFRPKAPGFILPLRPPTPSVSNDYACHALAGLFHTPIAPFVLSFRPQRAFSAAFSELFSILIDEKYKLCLPHSYAYLYLTA